MISTERQMMSEAIMKDNQLKAAITVSEMCSILGMSRTQFYEHVKRGTFHQPLRLSNGRPYFNASQVADNIKAKELGVGVNGEYVLFYTRSESPKERPTEPLQKLDLNELLSGLQSLALSGLSTKQVSDAVTVCFPKGIDSVDENDILRTVFRHLKRSGVA